MKRRLLAALTLALGLHEGAHAGTGAADPSAQLTQGAALYAANCQRCHGPTGAEGEVGDIRGLSARVLRHATQAGIGMMPRIPLTPEEVAAIAAHLGRDPRD